MKSYGVFKKSSIETNQTHKSQNDSTSWGSIFYSIFKYGDDCEQLIMTVTVEYVQKKYFDKNMRRKILKTSSL